MISINQNDEFLQSLVIMVNAENSELSITLMTGGFKVTGKLVSEYHYFQEIQKRYPKQVFTDIDQSIVEEMKQGTINSFLKSSSDFTGTVNMIPEFLHMINATVHKSNDNGFSEGVGVLWRGTIDKVSGYYFTGTKGMDSFSSGMKLEEA